MSSPMKQYLLTAGPTPVPERVLLAMARPVLYHRAPGFTECLKETQEGLKWLFQTSQTVLQLAGSGTLAMEAAVTNFLRQGDRVLVIRGGKFGERWGKIAQAYGVETVNIDVMCLGSQKALMLPPGLAMIAVSDKAWEANKRSTLPRFYTDLARERRSQEKGENAFTPAVSLVVGLQESLRMLKEETLEGVWHRHERLAKATRAASGGLGLEPFSSSPVNSVTGFRMPAGIDGSAVIKQM